MEMNLSEKTFVVTGATSGIGLATAELLARSGAAVIGVGRSAERCRETEQRLRQLSGNPLSSCMVADLSLQQDVKDLAERIATLLNSNGKSGLNGLVNNAGAFTYWLTLTPEGVEMQWAVNHLAPFLLTRQLLPLLKAAPAGRVVTVSSGSHYGAKIPWDDPQLCRRYNGLKAYGITKLSNILFTLEFNNRYASGSNLRAFAADPGLVKTDIGMKGTPPIARLVWKIRRSGGTTAETPARGIVYLLTEPSIATTDKIYWKDGRPKEPSREAMNVESAARLWQLSERMCGLASEG